MNSLAERWENFFQNHVGGEDADEHRAFLEATFYAGAGNMFDMIEHILTTEGLTHEEVIEDLLQLQEELSTFVIEYVTNEADENEPH